jgi:YHS domain-containing protein
MMAMTMAKDPVCGMTVDPATASRTSEYEGQTYFFCAPACKKAFEADPQQYLGASGRDASCSCHTTKQ